MGEETVAELQIPDVDDAVKGVEALDVDAGDDVDEHDADLAPQAAGGKPSSVNMSPADAKVEAVALIDDDRLLQAARLLRRHAVDVPIANPLDATDAKLNAFVPKAAVMEDLIDSIKSNPKRPGTEWLVQCEHSGRRDVSIYYRIDTETQTKLTARIESPIHKDMLVPFLFVLNESELYKSWLPNWTMPRLRVRRSDKLSQTGRCSQVVLVTVDLPWPFSSRECVLDAWGVDDIDASGDICVLVDSMKPGESMYADPSSPTSTKAAWFESTLKPVFCSGSCLKGGRRSGTPRGRRRRGSGRAAHRVLLPRVETARMIRGGAHSTKRAIQTMKVITLSHHLAIRSWCLFRCTWTRSCRTCRRRCSIS